MDRQQIQNILAKNLRDLMNERGLGVSELTKRCQVSHGMISKIMHGTTGITIATAMELATGLDISLESLLSGINQPNKKKKSKRVRKILSIGILSIDNKRLTCIKDPAGNIVGESQLEKGLDLVESSSNLLRLIQESIAAALHENKKFLADIKNSNLKLVTQSYEFEETRSKFIQFTKRHFKDVEILSDWQLTYLCTFGTKSGLSLTVDKGTSLSYMMESRIKKIGGWKFPVYDLGGENWLGSEAVKHTIEAIEGLVPTTELSHKILSKFSGKVEKLVETCLRSHDADILCLLAEPLIRLYQTGDDIATTIVKQGFKNIDRLIKRADAITEAKNQIVVNGSLSDIYTPFLEASRVVKASPDTKKVQLLANLDTGLIN